ncbi:MAG TPA: hypothetical protein VIV60_12275 [Polyangiaceae bacterium]
MSDPVSTNDALGYYDNFEGLNESDHEAPESFARESCNVIFKNGRMMRRPGREKVIATTQQLLRPVSAGLGIQVNTAETWVEYAGLLGDGDTATAVVTNPFKLPGSATATHFAVGMPFKFLGVKFYIGTASSFPAGTTLVANKWNRMTGALASFTITDGTAVGGITMKQTGTVNWAASVLDDWTPGFTNTAIDAKNPFSQDLYWVIFTLSNGSVVTGLTLTELQVTLQGTDAFSCWTPATGITEFVPRSGGSMVVGVHPFPHSLSNDALHNARPDERLIAYDFNRGDCIALNLPVNCRTTAGLSTFNSFATFNGFLLGSTSDGILWRFDGTTIAKLEALPGMDMKNQIAGAQSYLPNGPRGTILTTYRNRLLVAGDPNAPLTFYASLEDNNYTNIPPEAPVGGPNVWPLNYVFNVPGSEGDKITGMKVVNDRLIILTRTNIFWFDDAALKPANYDFGCISPGSVQKIDDFVYFLSEQGVVVTNGIEAAVLSGPVGAKSLGQMNFSMAETFVSAHDRASGEYWLWFALQGEHQNTTAVVYNYIRKRWRVVSGWFPWDLNGRRTSFGITQNITAACNARAADGRRVVLSCDGSGVLWHENVGLDDDGKVFPAYVILKPVQFAEQYLDARQWYMNASMDGQWYEAYALHEGNTLGQEIDRRYNNIATVAEVVQKQALLQNTVSDSTNTEPTYAASPVWGSNKHTSKQKKLKFSFGKNVTKMTPAIVWEPGQFSAGSYVNPVTAEGVVADLKVTVSDRGTGR